MSIRIESANNEYLRIPITSRAELNGRSTDTDEHGMARYSIVTNDNTGYWFLLFSHQPWTLSAAVEGMTMGLDSKYSLISDLDNR